VTSGRSVHAPAPCGSEAGNSVARGDDRPDHTSSHALTLSVLV